MLPFFLIRLVLLPSLNRESARRASESAPVYDWEKLAANIYQLTSVAIFIYPFFMRAEADFSWQFWTGAALYVLGLALLTASVTAFARPDENGLVSKGAYRFSRNPMYISCFICFLGISALAKSPILISLAIVNQLAAHWVIKAEERSCLEQLGENYRLYMQRVRRYL